MGIKGRGFNQDSAFGERGRLGANPIGFTGNKRQIRDLMNRAGRPGTSPKLNGLSVPRFEAVFMCAPTITKAEGIGALRPPGSNGLRNWWVRPGEDDRG
jgi:hypothetical protein